MQTLSKKTYLSLAISYEAPSLASSYLGQDLTAGSEPIGYNVEVTSAVKPMATALHKKLHDEINFELDHKHINKIPAFIGSHPTFEKLCLHSYGIAKSVVGDQLVSLSLHIPQLATVSVGCDREVKVTFFDQINCVHRHHNPELSMAENKELYGKCSGIHGHEYKIEFSLKGHLNSLGQVFDWAKARQLIKNEIIEKYDKAYLNEKMGNTSGELIIRRFFSELKTLFPVNLKPSLVLRETLKNSFYVN